MEGLFSFLLFAVFFYLMMRFGCGAHMSHGHHGHGGSHEDSSQELEQQSTIDPVCGVHVDDQDGYRKLHHGHLIRFCSKKCLDKFDQNPEKIMSQLNHKVEHHHET